MGPVHEKETMASVRAIKKMPPIFPIPDFEPAVFASAAGNVISNPPKKENANTTKIIKKRMFNQTLVEILLKIAGFVFPAI